MYDISTFKINDLIIGTAKIVYKVISITKDLKRKQFYSIIENIETSERFPCTHEMNCKFKLINVK